MKNQNVFLLALAVLLFIFFFVLQVTVKPNESTLFVLSCLTLLAVLLVSHIQNSTVDWNFVGRETKVALIGLVLGLIIEVGLGMVARQQHWEGASLFGVPYWLPIMWAAGFVVIGRIYTFIMGQ